MTPEDIAAVTESGGYKHLVKYIKDRLGEPPLGEVAKIPDGPGLHRLQAGEERVHGRQHGAQRETSEQRLLESRSDHRLLARPPSAPRRPDLVRSWMVLSEGLPGRD